MIVAIKLVMSAATLIYAVGLVYRHRDNARHRRLMALGFAVTLTIAVALVVGVHVFGSTYGAAVWLVQAAGRAGAETVLLVHRGVATVTLLALVAQVVTGALRHPAHGALARVTVPLWLLSYVSGMFIFV